MEITIERNTKRIRIDGVKSAPVWVRQGLEPDAILYAEKFGENLASNNSFTSTQFRNIFSEVLRIKTLVAQDDNWQRDFLLLKPRFVYAMARKGTKGSENFRKVIAPAMDEVLAVEDDAKKKERFKNFADFFEAILAFHRANGGK